MVRDRVIRKMVVMEYFQKIYKTFYAENNSELDRLSEQSEKTQKLS